MIERSFAIAATLAMGTASARAEDGLVLYGAGSLREAVGEIAATFGKSHALSVRTEFGASGRMRERIEAGDRVDVFTSAEIGHARKLVQDGRARTMAMFASNTLCLLVPARQGAVTQASLLDTLLDGGLKIGVSPARIDPLGDYTVALYGIIEGLRPGSGAGLKARSVPLDNPPGTPAPRSGDLVVDALADGRIDIAVVYCSGGGRFARLAPDTRMVALPEPLQVGPQYGLAVMKEARPEATWLALAILSPEGQQILSRNGFKPVALPTE